MQYWDLVWIQCEKCGKEFPDDAIALLREPEDHFFFCIPCFRSVVGQFPLIGA